MNDASRRELLMPPWRACFRRLKNNLLLSGKIGFVCFGATT
jgi:hypothetical protein